MAVPWQAEVNKSECVGVYGWMDMCVCVCRGPRSHRPTKPPPAKYRNEWVSKRGRPRVAYVLSDYRL